MSNDIYVLVVVPNVWGRGKTIEDAWENVFKVGGRSVNGKRRKSDRHNIYVTSDPKAFVDDMGGIMVHGEHWVQRISEYVPKAMNRRVK